MDRLLLRASELNTRVQEKAAAALPTLRPSQYAQPPSLQADEFATKRGEEIQRVLQSNVWEEEPAKKSKKKKGKRKQAAARVPSRVA